MTNPLNNCHNAHCSDEETDAKEDGVSAKKF
jgi:hypothetical protein